MGSESLSASDRWHLGTGELEGRTFVAAPHADEQQRVNAILELHDELLAAGMPSQITASALAESCRSLRIGGMVATPRSVPGPAPAHWVAPVPLPIPLPMDEPAAPLEALEPWWSVIHPERAGDQVITSITLDRAAFEVEKPSSRPYLPPEVDDGQSPYFARLFDWWNRADLDTGQQASREGSVAVTAEAVVVSAEYELIDHRIEGSSTVMALLVPVAATAKDALSQFTRRKQTLRVGYRIPLEALSAVSVQLTFASTKPIFGRKEKALFAQRGYGSLTNVDVDLYWFDGWRQVAARVGTDHPWDGGDEDQWRERVEALITTLGENHPPPSGASPRLQRFDASFAYDVEYPQPCSISAPLDAWAGSG